MRQASIVAVASVRHVVVETSMFRKLRPFVLLSFLTFSQPVGAGDSSSTASRFRLTQRCGADARECVPAMERRLGRGVGGTLKHILLVESVSEDGAARVVYAVGENPYAGIQPRWLRLEGIVRAHAQGDG